MVQIIKRQSKQKYVNKKTGKEGHYYNYFVQAENGKRIQIKCAFNDDVKALDMIATFEK